MSSSSIGRQSLSTRISAPTATISSRAIFGDPYFNPAASNPAPDSYNTPASSFSKQILSDSKSAPAITISTSKHFEHDERTPGVGCYRVRNVGIEPDPKEFSIQSKHGVIDSHCPNPRWIEDKLGPGVCRDDEGFGKRPRPTQKKAPRYTMASRYEHGGIFDTGEQKRNPGPGTYREQFKTTSTIPASAHYSAYRSERRVMPPAKQWDKAGPGRCRVDSSFQPESFYKSSNASDPNTSDMPSSFSLLLTRPRSLNFGRQIGRERPPVGDPSSEMSRSQVNAKPAPGPGHYYADLQGEQAMLYTQRSQPAAHEAGGSIGPQESITSSNSTYTVSSGSGSGKGSVGGDGGGGQGEGEEGGSSESRRSSKRGRRVRRDFQHQPRPRALQRQTTARGVARGKMEIEGGGNAALSHFGGRVPRFEPTPEEAEVRAMPAPTDYFHGGDDGTGDIWNDGDDGIVRSSLGRQVDSNARTHSEQSFRRQAQQAEYDTGGPGPQAYPAVPERVRRRLAHNASLKKGVKKIPAKGCDARLGVGYDGVGKQVDSRSLTAPAASLKLGGRDEIRFRNMFVDDIPEGLRVGPGPQQYGLDRGPTASLEPYRDTKPASLKYSFSRAPKVGDALKAARLEAKELTGMGGAPGAGTYDPMNESAFGAQVDSHKPSMPQALLLGKCLVEPRFAGARSGGDRLGHLDFLDLDHQLRRIRGAEWEKQATTRGGSSSLGKQVDSTQPSHTGFSFSGSNRFDAGGKMGGEARVKGDDAPGPGAYAADSNLLF